MTIPVTIPSPYSPDERGRQARRPGRGQDIEVGAEKVVRVVRRLDRLEARIVGAVGGFELVLALLAEAGEIEVGAIVLIRLHVVDLADHLTVVLEGAYFVSTVLDDPSLPARQLELFRRHIEALLALTRTAS